MNIITSSCTKRKKRSLVRLLMLHNLPCLHNWKTVDRQIKALLRKQTEASSRLPCDVLGKIVFIAKKEGNNLKT